MGKLNKKRNKRISSQLIKVYSLILFITVLVITVTVTLTVSLYLLHQEKQSINEIQGEFEKTAQSDGVDWEQTLNELVFFQYPNHVITLEDQYGNVYHTPNWQEFMDDEFKGDVSKDNESNDNESSDNESSDNESSDNESSDNESSDNESNDNESNDNESNDNESNDNESKLNDIEEGDTVKESQLFPSIYLHDDEGLYLVEQFTVSSDIEVTVYASLETLTEFIVIMTFIIFAVAAIALFFGLFLIYFTTKKNTRPILELTEAIGNFDYKNNLKKGVSVPDAPLEVANLEQSFNTLVSELDGYIENEKVFVSNASHELRTPIGAIRGNAGLIKRRGAEHPEVIEPAINAIYEETIRAEKTISQLLDMTRDGNYQPEKTKVNISDLVFETSRQFLSAAEQFTLDANVEPNLNVLGNSEQIRRILIILLDNAKKYIDEKGTISVSLTQRDSHVYLSVKDDGIGIPSEDLHKIFKRFYRVDPARASKTGGTGLGLSIAQQLVEQHNGTIRAESELSKGATFTVVIPIWIGD